MPWRLFVAVILIAAPAFGQSASLHLSIGDPARKEKEVPLVLDAVMDTATGELLTPQEAVSRLGTAKLIFLGESHTSIDFHRAQLRVIQELVRMGKKVFIGLEMYPYTEQKYLDDWCRGYLTESGFVDLSRWYANWGYNWNYYRDIFLYARDNGIRMFAVNAPRDVVSAVRKKGFQNLTPEEAKHIPATVDTKNEDHFSLFKAFFAEESGMHSGMSDQMARSMFEAQCTWDATMAFNSVRALQEHGDAYTVMVVLVGSGHVAYGMGLERQAVQWLKDRMASIIPVEVRDGRNRPVETVRASYANFLWGLPQERETLYPDLGLSAGDVPGDVRRKVLSVATDSVAKRAGFQVGDILLSMDNVPLKEKDTLNRLMAAKRWGDAAEFAVKRGEQEITLRAEFRRQPPRAGS